MKPARPFPPAIQGTTWSILYWNDEIIQRHRGFARFTLATDATPRYLPSDVRIIQTFDDYDAACAVFELFKGGDRIEDWQRTVMENHERAKERYP